MSGQVMLPSVPLPGKRLCTSRITMIGSRQKKLQHALVAALLQRLTYTDAQDENYGIRIKEGLGVEIHLVHGEIIPSGLLHRLSEYARGFKDAAE
jgi:hypothetical protein